MAQQHIKTPLQQNYVHVLESEDDEDPLGEENHLFTADGLPIYLTKDKEYFEIQYVQKDEDFILANDTILEEESDEY